ncbi:putative vesicular-fusion protein sec17-like protein [Lachnellula suecica]|uniref:Putative vesicular-fusion protein sec17-like protein n=1 Tax=Lachnellula suecica TaxID=602035 RepID=A0A8T9CFY2_9HELO|nr:putative vesicular-fusion protein sec17-like protein [Lachnellula suecica]
MNKANDDAGKAFERAAEIQTGKLNEPDDAANTMVEAYKVYRKDRPLDAIRCLDVAIQRYASKGALRRAATHQQNKGDTYEIELRDEKSALEAYEVAADWYETDNAEALANKLYLKVGELAALVEDWPKAIEKFEKVAAASVNNNLMKWSVKDYFLKAGLVHMVTTDMVAFNRAVEHYRDMDPTFASTREHQLLVDLGAAVEQGDEEIFADKLFQYDQVSKLDKWKTTILLKIKGQIEAAGEDFS